MTARSFHGGILLWSRIVSLNPHQLHDPVLISCESWTPHRQDRSGLWSQAGLPALECGLAAVGTSSLLQSGSVHRYALAWM